jgi:multidrug efflux pump
LIPHFFIDRPIFAAVLSIVIALTGGIALVALPIAQYPSITPPSVQVAITYPGASAQVVADTVASPIEQQVNGVQGMLYMSSQMGNDGSYTLTVTFDLGTDLNTALVMVQNRVTLAIPQLPNSVQQQGITIKKKTPDLLMIVSFLSPDGRYDDLYLSNFATIYVRDELLRVPGVSDITYMGERDYSVRAWLDPQKMAACGMTAVDVANAIRSQNLAAALGQLGQAPVPKGQAFEVPIDATGRLVDPEQFGEIVVKVGTDRQSAPGSQGSPRGNTGLPSTSSSATAQSGGMMSGASATSTIPSRVSGGIFAKGNGITVSNPPMGRTQISTSLVTGLSPDPLPPLAIGDVGGTPTSSISGNAMAAGGVTAGGSSSTGSSSAGGSASQTSSTPGRVGTNASAGTSGGGGTSASLGPGNSPSAGVGSIVGGTSGPRPKRPSTPIVRLRDVARVEIGAQNYIQSCTFDGRPAVGLAVRQLPGTNALDVADQVRKKVDELKSRFPDGIEYSIAYDTTPYIRQSVEEVVRTLLEAVVLVGIVVMTFLQNWRAAVIPLVAVPVAIVGTFAVMIVLGFSLNNISLFGLVLAIGIVVDDAIVVVENVERWMEQGLEPREATRKAMDEVTGPVVAVALVLCAVFVPCAFISGITGQFFRQFAVTIAVSTVFSAFNSLTLSPALATILLRPRGKDRDPLTRFLDFVLGWPFRLFNRGFEAGTAAYAWSVGKLLRGSPIVLLAYGGLVGLTFWVFGKAPTGFIPEQDQGRLIVGVQLADSSSLQRTQDVMARIEKITRETPGVAHTITLSGMSFVLSATSSNYGSMFVILDPFEKRRSPDLRDTAIMARLRREWAKEVNDAQVTVYGAPPIPGLSVAGGFKLMVEDRGGLGLASLQSQTDDLARKMRGAGLLTGVSSQFRSNTPQLFMDIDRTKVVSLGVSLDDVNQTLQMFLGSLYVNSYNEYGRYWQVTVQAEGNYRARVEDVNLLQVRNKWGRMVSMGTLVSIRDVGGPVFVTRYNLATAAPITGSVSGNTSSGTAIDAIDVLSAQSLPRSMKTEWTELMFMQIRAGNTAMYVFALAVVFVFLALAALYESWSLPLAVILVVPLCLLCSVVGVLAAHRSVDIFVQIGLIVLVGLACKNAILIVEFASELHRGGKDRYEATLEASRLRLRPIMMTSLAFILGVVPLVVAEGAGAEMRQSLGTAVFSGMLGVTMFGIFLTPVFFYVIQRLGESRLFESPSIRRVVPILVGGVLGVLAGFLVAGLGVGSGMIAPVLGGCAGAVITPLAFAIHRGIREKSAPHSDEPGTSGEGRPS